MHSGDWRTEVVSRVKGNDQMTLLQWVSSRYNSAPRTERQASVVPIARSKPRVQAEYMSLYTYLEERYATTVVLTFEQMESLLGHTLPERASTDNEWWTDEPTGRGHAEAWMAARRVATPNLMARTVTFERLP
jgi:hypothetical protein